MKMAMVNREKILVPPIKSQGIKTKLVPFIMEVVKAAGVTGKWIEPFMGTGVVGFNSGFERALVNDINPHLINFYNNIKAGEITHDRVKQYLEHEGQMLAHAEENGYAHYRFIRDRFNKEGFSPLDFLFLNRAGFNGMIRFSKKGYWNIPFCKKPKRFEQSYVTKITNQIKKVQNIITNKWEFTNCSFEDAINQATENDIIYCDPPYFGRYVDYYNGWNEKNEEKLFHCLDNSPAKFVLSTWSHNKFRHNTMIDKYWSKFNVLTKQHFYHGGGKLENRNEITEALFFNFEITNTDTKKNQLLEKAEPTATNNQLRFELV